MASTSDNKFVLNSRHQDEHSNNSLWYQISSATTRSHQKEIPYKRKYVCFKYYETMDLNIIQWHHLFHVTNPI